jgi:protein-serine/threonine kinase
LGAIGEKKSFFQKMFHHDKHDKVEKASRPPSPHISPHPTRTSSPPLTPTSETDPARPPSRQHSSSKQDIHDQPPQSNAPKRRLSERSVVATGQGAVAVESTGKFTLKDLLGRGDGKLTRKASASGSARGSDKGSTKGSEHGDTGSTASLLAKYGVCEKAAIGKGATAVVRLAHKWDRREEKLYAVKVHLIRI